jgi:hypothetical protein
VTADQPPPPPPPPPFVQEGMGYWVGAVGWLGCQIWAVGWLCPSLAGLSNLDHGLALPGAPIYPI